MTYILRKWTVATVQVVYYIPDHLHIVNEFMWQTQDQLPEYPRITRFLDYWDKHIDGPIKEVYIYDQQNPKVRIVDRQKLRLNHFTDRKNGQHGHMVVDLHSSYHYGCKYRCPLQSTNGTEDSTIFYRMQRTM